MLCAKCEDNCNVIINETASQVLIERATKDAYCYKF